MFFVELNPVNPIALRISAISGSESASSSMLSFSLGLVSLDLEGAFDEEVPLVLVACSGEVSTVGRGGLDDGCLVKARGPVGGTRSLAGFEGGLRDRGALEWRVGVRVRVRVDV